MLKRIWIQKSRMKNDFIITKFYIDRPYEMIFVRNFSKRVYLGSFTEHFEELLSQFDNVI